MATYLDMLELSLSNPGRFWRDEALKLGLRNVPVKHEVFVEWNFDCGKGPVFVKWMPVALANMSYSCLDKHLEAGGGDKVAFYW